MKKQPPRVFRPVTLAALGGFVAGMLFVAIVVWQYGNVIGSRDARAQFPPNPPAAIERFNGEFDDGGAGVLVAAEPTAVRETAVRETPTSEIAAPPRLTATAGSVVDDLRSRRLEPPVESIRREDLKRSFTETRGGARRHEAMDIFAPRNAPVVAVEEGTIARLFFSRAGGITVYQFDPSERYVYYYAHLERYADGLREGDRVRRGQVIGYVGTSGNAPKNTPHLHFAIFRLTDEKRWWEGTPIDPYEVLR